MMRTPDSDDMQLSSLRAKLPKLDRAMAVEVVLQYQDDALQRSENHERRIVQLARILEDCDYGQDNVQVGYGVCEGFWRNVIAARETFAKRQECAEEIISVIPDSVFDYYGWRDLAETSMRYVHAMVQQCRDMVTGTANLEVQDLDQEDRLKAWTLLRVELNRSMLRRDQRYRDRKRISPNVGKLIGEHYSTSKIQGLHRPLEPQDFREAHEHVKKWTAGGAAHSTSNVVGDEAMFYLRKNNLGFDRHGMLVSKGGTLDENSLKLYLAPNNINEVATQQSKSVSLLRAEPPSNTNELQRPMKRARPETTGIPQGSPPANAYQMPSQGADNVTSTDQGSYELDANVMLGSVDSAGRSRQRSPGLLLSAPRNNPPDTSDQPVLRRSDCSTNDRRPAWRTVLGKIADAMEAVSAAQANGIEGRDVKDLLQVASKKTERLVEATARAG